MHTRKVVIVGGGSSGWIAAAYLQKALNVEGLSTKVDITLIESPDIPRISVGEATIPNIRHLLQVIGINEMEFMKATDATFKQSIKYTNWVHKDNSFYHHPFSRVRKQPLDFSAQDWLESDQKIPFMESCSEQPIICEMNLAPLMLQPWNMGAPLTYAYHMNAQKFADFLRDVSIPRGVKHILANVTDIQMKNDELIKSVDTDTGLSIEADLFVDCTGFRAKLIEEKLNVGWEDHSQWLLCDKAITMHVPYDKYYPGKIRPYTSATALSNGWVWDIPMQNQRSIGYVHSSAFIGQDDAEKELRAYQGGNTEELDSRTIYFKVGRREQNWKGNCVAIGLSGGFIEPLESTGLYLSDLGAVALAEYFPYTDDDLDSMAFRYNRILSNRFYEILDFINMHYCLTKRTDTEFWKAVQRPEHINPRLQAKLDFWKHRPPTQSDFDDQAFLNQTQPSFNFQSDTFDSRPPVDTAGLWNHESYECILYGMHFNSEKYNELYGENRSALQVHPYILQRLQMARQKLPPHEIWLQRVLGMQQHSGAIKPKGWVS